MLLAKTTTAEQTTKKDFMLYDCDPIKNTECRKTNCHINGGECYKTSKKEYEVQYEMENEIRYYLKQILLCMSPEENTELFEPQYLITAVKLPTGAIELAVNNKNIKEKIEYILDAYDEEMRLKTNADIVMQNIMVV